MENERAEWSGCGESASGVDVENAQAERSGCGK